MVASSLYASSLCSECGGSSSITQLRPESFMDVRPSQVMRYELLFPGEGTNTESVLSQN